MNIDVSVQEDGVLVDATTAVLSDAGGVYGVKRLDTGGVVVAAGTALTRLSEGVYRHSFVEPAPNLAYLVAVSLLVRGVWRRSVAVLQGSEDQTDLEAALDAGILAEARAPFPLIHETVRRVFVDFCQQTECWVHESALVSVSGDAEYALPLPALTDVLRVCHVTVDGYPRWMHPPLPGSTSVRFTHPLEQDGLTIRAQLRLAPKPSRRFAPGWLVSRYRDRLVSGALAELLGMEGVPWSKPQRARWHREHYDSGIALARGHTITQRGPVARIRIPEL